MRWAILGLACCAGGAPDGGAALPVSVTLQLSGGGSGGDFFHFHPGERAVQALECDPDDGGISCIERLEGGARALVPYRWQGGRWVGALDHLADAGAPAQMRIELRERTAVYALPSTVVSPSRVEGHRALAGHGEPIAWLDAGTDAVPVQRAVDVNGQVWLELRSPLSGWVSRQEGERPNTERR